MDFKIKEKNSALAFAQQTGLGAKNPCIVVAGAAESCYEFRKSRKSEKSSKSL